MVIDKQKKGFYTAVWCINDEESFRLNIPLESLGRSVNRYNSSFKIKVLVLEGYNRLSLEYLDNLKQLGFEIINYDSLFLEIIDKFPNINHYYSRYERNCFLRWVVFKKITEEEKLEQFWHLDSDIILHTSLDDIESDTSGKTFMLEGCPVMVSVSDFNWFKIYEIELLKLEFDILKYSDIAFRNKESCKNNDIELCNQSLYRNPLGSDQDFLEYLVSSFIIKQDTSSVVFNSSFYFSQNSLVFSFWNQLQNIKGTDNIVTEGENREIWYGGKRVPFIHYQGSFCDFANIYIFLVKVGLIKLSVIKKIINFKINETEFKISPTSTVVLKFIKLLNFNLSRSEVIEFLSKPNKKTKTTHLVELINFINIKV